MEFGDISGITGYASSIAQSAGASKMAGQAKAASTDDELMEACKEFETYLWEQVLKSMKSTVNFTGEEEESQLVGFFMDSTITEVAGQMTEKSMGPNSLAQQMYDQMKRTNTIDVESLLAQSALASGISTEE